MKKKRNCRSRAEMCVARKIFMTMKLTFLLLFIGMMQLSASVYSQHSRLSLDLKNCTVKEALQRIEERSEYRFFFNEQFIDLNRRVSVKTENEKVENILNEIFASTKISYKVMENNLILITPKDEDFTMDSRQSRTISGKVTDSSGGPLPGVSIIIKGTNQGTITDTDGNYSLTSVPVDGVLLFSFVGMKSQEMPVDGKTSIDVVLKEETIGLDEVVAIGYGTQKKINLTGSISSVNFSNEMLESRAVQNVSTALSGLTTGMLITQTSGHPNEAEATIKIRGTGSLNSSSDPLVIIDGVIGDMDNIHPSDVADISILKDAASAAIYGSRASNGVILITTKNGKDTDGKVTFNYDGYYGLTGVTKSLDLVTNTADHLSMINLLETNSGFAAPFPQETINEWREKSKTDPVDYPNTDFLQWSQDHTPNYLTNHKISASGGTKSMNFYTSLNYQENSGLLPNTSTQRYTFRNNMTFKVNDWLTLGNNVSLLSEVADPADSELIWSWWVAAFPGQLPRYNVNGIREYGGEQIEVTYNANNPVYYAETRYGERKTRRYTGKVFGILSPVKGLKVNASYFLDRSDYNDVLSEIPKDRWNFQNMTVVTDNTTGAVITLEKNNNITERRVVDVYADYDFSLTDHSFHFLAGFNQEYYKYETNNITKEDLVSLDTPVLNSASGTATASGTITDFAMRSYFGRFNYNFKNRYLFEANVRYDGSSRFSPDERWGLFPSFSAAWRVSEEDFWTGGKVINDLKIRASYGKLGNNGIGNYEWQNFYNKANVSFGQSAASALIYNDIANEAITWETTNVTDIGIDLQFLDKFSGTFDYYYKYTDGILIREPIPLVNGGLNAPRVNSGEVSNSGFEFALNYHTKIRELSLSAGMMLSYNRNRIEKYKGDYIEKQDDATVWTEGQPIGKFYLREVDHIVKNQSEVDAMIADGWAFYPATPGEGDFMYKNNNDDKMISDDDRVLMGNPIPVYTYNANLSLSYKGFDFYVLVDGVAKWDKYLKGGIHELQHLTGAYLWPKSYLNATWTEDNRDAKIPKIYHNQSLNDQESEFFLHKADYLKVRTIQLGYTIPKFLSQKVFLDRARVYIDLQNYFVFTSYPGQDPENQYAGREQTYPSMKSMSFGLNLTF